jgi:hypothetical protein
VEAPRVGVPAVQGGEEDLPCGGVERLGRGGVEVGAWRAPRGIRHTPNLDHDPAAIPESDSDTVPTVES